MCVCVRVDPLSPPLLHTALPTNSPPPHHHLPHSTPPLNPFPQPLPSLNGQLPKGFGEKNEFKELVKSMARPQKESEINFEEALANAFRAYSEPGE